MTDLRVPVVRTVVAPQGYASAVLSAWPEVGEGVPSKESVAVLYGQWMQETGGASCWCWNFSNAKWTPGCGFDYCCLNGVWEGVTPGDAEVLIETGRAIRDPSPDHAHAVGEGKVSVIFPPPSPESRFRAFPDLATGMLAHLKLLRRFAAAWAGVLAGDPVRTALALGAGHYFTASAKVYGEGMQKHWQKFMAYSAYELAVEALTDPDGVRASEVDPAADTVPAPTVHADPSVYLGNGPPDE